MSNADVDQAIQRLTNAAATLTLDQRLRIAALLAQPTQPPAATQPSPSTQTATESLVLTVEETAELLKTGRTTVYDLLKSGELSSIMIGRLRRIRHTDLTAYLNHLNQNERT